jgi:hypothetical protein
VNKVDALIAPGLAAHAGSVDLEAALVELHDAMAAHDAASRELDSFLEAALIGELGADLYKREVARRREAVSKTASVDLRARLPLSSGESLSCSTTSIR